MTTRTQYIIGVDLGGTKVVAGTMTADGSRAFAVRSAPTHAELGAEGVVHGIITLIEGVIHEAMAETGRQA